MAIAGDTIVVGAYYDDDAGTASGSVYVFRTSDLAPRTSQVAKLTAADAAPNDQFGSSVAIDGATVVVGALEATTTASLGLGLRLPHDQRRRHVRPGGQADGRRRRGSDYFGRSVAIDGNTIVVGAKYNTL